MAMARAAGAGAMLPGGGGDTKTAAPADAASDPGSGSAFKNVQQLGLELKSRKMPVDLIVVDKVEKGPTEN